MPRLLRLTLVLIFCVSAFAVNAKKGKLKLNEEDPVDLLTTVSGTVILTTKNANLDADIIQPYRGRDQIVVGKKGKKINVAGTYSGDGQVTVQEEGDFADEEERNIFKIPVLSVMDTFTRKGKDTARFEILNLLWGANQEGAPSVGSVIDNIDNNNNAPAPGDDNPVGSVNKITKKLKKFLVKANGAMSIKKLTATRKNNKGILKGTFFRGDSPAKGRFKLIFTP